jgi:hypothetical protein
VLHLRLASPVFLGAAAADSCRASGGEYKVRNISRARSFPRKNAHHFSDDNSLSFA